MERTLDQLIGKITDDLNIEDVISHYITVERKGNSAVAICPFHQDSNPSLSISNAKKIFKCFVCNVGGNAITFVQKYKKVSFIEAIKIIADDFNLNWKDYFTNSKSVVENPKIKEIKKINLETLNFYKYNLRIEIEKNSHLKNYLNKRKLTDDLLETFSIGWAKNDNSLKDFLLKKDFKEEEILRASLVKNKDGRLNDLFFQRLIFPIIDQDNQILGFSGRIINNNNSIKYLNSSENLLFNKGKILYNLNNATEEILFKNNVIIVEGFMDVISFFKINIKNVVASMGTAFNINHIEKLKKLTKNFTLAFDNDQAGIETTIKTYNILKRHNINLSIINLSDDGKDIDEIISKNNKINQSYFEDRKISFLDFYYQKVIEKLTLESIQENKLREMLEIILSSKDFIKKEIILNKVKVKFGDDLINNFTNKIKLNPERKIFFENNLTNKNNQNDVNILYINKNLNKFEKKFDQEEFKLLINCFLSPILFDTLIKNHFVFVNEIYMKIFNLVIQNKELINGFDKTKTFFNDLLINSENDDFKKIVNNLIFNYQEFNKNENLLKELANINIENQIKNLAYKWRILGKENYKKNFIETDTTNDNDEKFDYLIERLKTF
ncbi:/ dnaG / DNA primase /:373208 Reverse [Candidatus Hepatoplasma crinochetorum]|uniref:DNA primase n=1 Tax=Candidatus Hepatoplasma crinochetorum TaxID=295596 RepID=A0A0G7ZN20_9MOLU|nr:/ dnaG / DNA primase /:373208 Reverse [Candidatus Hepatoplasma crinochetorum]